MADELASLRDRNRMPLPTGRKRGPPAFRPGAKAVSEPSARHSTSAARNRVPRAPSSSGEFWEAAWGIRSG